MDTTGYIALTRQSGLLKELQVVANNIANISTTGFRREGVVFAEELRSLDTEGGGVAMTSARVRFTDADKGSTTRTGGMLDFAIDGPGFFMVETPTGERLTRAGSFSTNAEGDLVSMTGYRVLDSSGSPIFIPPDAGRVGVAQDGTVSIGGRPSAQIGIFEVENPQMLLRESGVLFRFDAEANPAENSRVMQGFLEGSNVDAVTEMARLIEVQRAYELGQNLLDSEDERIRSSIRTLGQVV